MKTNPIAHAIGFSRFIGLTNLVILGLSINLGLALFVLSPFVIQISGNEVPRIFMLSMALFLPLLLSYTERAQDAPGSASSYQLARLGSSSWVVFLTGWLILAGHIALTELLAASVSLRVQGIISHLFNVEIADNLLLTLIIIVAGFNEFFRPDQPSPFRNFLVWICLLTILVILGTVVYSSSPVSHMVPTKELARSWLPAVVILASTLWGLEVIFSARSQIRNPDKNLLWASILVFLIVTVMGAVGSIVSIYYPDLLTEYWLLHFSRYDNRIVFALLLTGSILCWVGLSRILASSLRLISAMINDGFFHHISAASDGNKSASTQILILTVLILGLHYASISDIVIAGIASLTWLWSLILILTPHIRRTKSNLSRIRKLKLPLHPLVPVISCVIALYLSALLPWTTIIMSLFWIAAGAIYYRLYGYRGKAVLERKQSVIGDDENLPEKSIFRVLVAVKPKQITELESLVKLGAALAFAHQGELLVVHSKPASKFLPLELSRIMAEKDWNSLDEKVNSIECAQVPIRSLIRIAPYAAEAILETAGEYKTDYIVLGAPSSQDDSGDEERSVVYQIFHRTSRCLAILKGSLTQSPKKILIAATGKSDWRASYKFSQAMAVADPDIKITMLTDSTTAEGLQSKIEPEEKQLEKHNTHTELKEIEGTDLLRAISHEADDYDLLIMGAAVDTNLNHAMLDGLPVMLAKRRNQPTMIVKAAESVKTHWFRRITWSISEMLPGLTISERTEIFSTMSRSARANADFYTLIILSSAIATLGLILNSAAVIIGAMLVAPLMNPILSIANGVVLGNFLLIKRGLKSSINGILVSITVSTAFVLLLPVVEPSSEVMARTQPNVFDLLVALAAGAVAAYAASRKTVAGALPGVAIAVALVPPLCVVGFGLGASLFPLAGGALLLFATNFAAIIIAGTAVFYLLGFRPSRSKGGNHARKAMVYAIIGLLILAIPLGFATRSSLEKTQIDALLIEQFAQNSGLADYQVQDIEVERVDNQYQIHFVLFNYSGNADIVQELEKLKIYLQQEVGVPVIMEAIIIDALRHKVPEK